MCVCCAAFVTLTAPPQVLAYIQLAMASYFFANWAFWLWVDQDRVSYVISWGTLVDALTILPEAVLFALAEAQSVAATADTLPTLNFLRVLRYALRGALTQASRQAAPESEYGTIAWHRQLRSVLFSKGSCALRCSAIALTPASQLHEQAAAHTRLSLSGFQVGNFKCSLSGMNSQPDAAVAFAMSGALQDPACAACAAHEAGRAAPHVQCCH